MAKAHKPVCAICGESKDVAVTAWSRRPECENPHCIYLRTLVRSRRMSVPVLSLADSPQDYHHRERHAGTFSWCQDATCRAARRMERIAV